MGEARDALERRVERFVDDVEALVRRATVAAVEDALGSGEAGAPAEERSAGPARRRHRLSPARARLLEQMVAYVTEHPGARMRDISGALRFRTDFLQPLMKRLLESGELRKEGERNQTRYFPAS